MTIQPSSNWPATTKVPTMSIAADGPTLPVPIAQSG